MFSIFSMFAIFTVKPRELEEARDGASGNRTHSSKRTHRPSMLSMFTVKPRDWKRHVMERQVKGHVLVRGTHSSKRTHFIERKPRDWRKSSAPLEEEEETCADVACADVTSHVSALVYLPCFLYMYHIFSIFYTYYMCPTPYI